MNDHSESMFDFDHPYIIGFCDVYFSPGWEGGLLHLL